MSKPILLSRKEAAAARRASVVTRATQPGQRRCAAASGPDLDRMVTRAEIQLRDAPDAGRLEFDGYATVYERGYEMWDWYGPYTEIMSAGAGEVSLKTPDLDVPLVLQHMQLHRIARTTNGSLTLAEDDTGLRTLAPELDPGDTSTSGCCRLNRLLGTIEVMAHCVMSEPSAASWGPQYTANGLRMRAKRISWSKLSGAQ